MPNFKDLRIVDNFYQTSSFFPMPTILISTLTETGETSIGSYSLCFPYYIAGKDYYAMLLQCRNNSNTAQNILRSSVCALNFITDERRYFKEAVKLGFPGDTSKEKMSKCSFTLTHGLASGERPQIIDEAFQVFECTWDNTLENAFEDQPGEMDGYQPPYRHFNGITSKFGAHFILKVDKILMEDRYCDSIINGAKPGNFPSIPIDYGYRDSTKFWYTKSKRPIGEPVPSGKELPVDGIIYAADRIDPDVKFTDDACAMLVKVPRVFLNTVLKASVKYAKENNITLITPTVMKAIQDKRSKEKN